MQYNRDKDFKDHILNNRKCPRKNPNDGVSGMFWGRSIFGETEGENTLDSGKAGNNVHFRDDSDNKKRREIIGNSRMKMIRFKLGITRIVSLKTHSVIGKRNKISTWACKTTDLGYFW